jgi:hypothetical protein
LEGYSLNGQSLGVTNVGKIADQLEAVNDLGASSGAALDTKAQDTTKASGKVLLGVCVVRVAFQAGVRNPGDVGAVLQILGHGQSVLGVALGAQTERLDTEDQLLGGKGVEGSADITQKLDSGADDEGDGAEGLPELEAVVALGGLDELGESLAVLAPVKLAGVDNNTSDGGSVAADPLGG